MAHRVIIYDEFGNEIGSYYPEHDNEGGRETARVALDTDAVVSAIQQSLGDKDAESVEVKFKRK